VAECTETVWGKFSQGGIIFHREDVRGIIWKGVWDGCPDARGAGLQVSV